jgi:hypothetical protein
VSYLGCPRLHFCGTFQADPSTVNNDPFHFDVARFRPGWDEPGAGATKGWWNPAGTGAWGLKDCTVRSVVYTDGTSTADSLRDPLVGRAVNSATDRVSGKLVDLDSEQQMVTELWGLQIGVTDVFVGEFEVAAFADIWIRYPKGHPDSFFSATYQSVLTDLDWGPPGDSRWVQELGASPQLSIKFTVDGFDDDPSSPAFTFGRISGAIGPSVFGEPHHLVAGRLMRPFAPAPMSPQSANFAPFRIEGNRLFVDLANSLPTVAVGGPLEDLGSLRVALLPADGEPITIGAVGYRRPGFYTDLAGIATLELSPDQAELAARTPIGLIATGPYGDTTLLREDADGTFVRADGFVFRLDPGVPATTKLCATRFGSPAVGQRIDLTADNSAMEAQQKQGFGLGPQVGTPADALSFPDSVVIGEDGSAEVTLSGRDPGNPRGYIDGQVYGIRFDWHGADLVQYVEDTVNTLSVLLWSGYTPASNLTWMDDIRPILRQYADLYPVMRSVLDLDDYHSVLENKLSLQFVFGFPVTHPNYMPVVRDLSTAKREALLSWLGQDHPPYMRVDTVEDVQRALQQAIELEHATIPTYLFSLFSIKDRRNRAVAEIINSVVLEEMLHMALACNVLNAIGGDPQIGGADFIPRYPGTLPGGLRPDLTVSLRKASIEHVRDVFMAIEEPEDTDHPKAHHGLTIGWFYGEIERGLTNLSDDPGLFSHNPHRQLSHWRGPGKMIAVHNLKTALSALREIVDQGEGTKGKGDRPSDPADGYDEIAHYYRFEEIVRGRRMVLHDADYHFTGTPIPFDPDGVWPVIDDPNPDRLHGDSLARRRAYQFDELYAGLLAKLHDVFNGRPDQLNTAIEMMFSLEVAAKRLMQTPIAAGSPQTMGPAFRDPYPLPDRDPSERTKPITVKGQPAPHRRT